MMDQKSQSKKAPAYVPFFPGEAVPMDRMPTEVSGFTEMYLLDLVMDVKGNKLSIFLSGSETATNRKFKVWRTELVNPARITDLENAAKHLLDGKGEQVDFTQSGQCGHSQKPTNLSVNLKRNCFLLFRVNGKIKNIRFSKDSDAFTREDIDTSPLKWPARFANGSLVRDGKNLGAGCTAAMFAYSWTDTSGKEGWERFNIQLDVVDDDVASEYDAYIPIIIDPDVRFPGGNEGP